MATSTLPESSRQIIQNQGMQVIDVEHLSPSQEQHPGFDPSFARFNDAWTKLRVFGLEGYDRVVLIDSDMIFTRSMDEVFDLELPGDDWIGAAPACVCNPFNIAHYPKDWCVS
jgi:alpha-N-acetylglucosamine transferase